MAGNEFTTEETAGNMIRGGRLLMRYLWHVRYLLYVSIPSLLLIVLPAVGYQLFIWLSGLLAECPALASCPARELAWGVEVTPSLWLLFVVAAVVVAGKIIEWNIFETGGQLASRGLFREMVLGIGRVRTTFFDEYPSGKIINRVIRDADRLRTDGPMRLGEAASGLIDLLVVIAVIAIASPTAALVALPLLLFFVYIQRNVAPMLERVLVLRSARFGEVLHRETDVIEGVRCFALYGQLPTLIERVSASVYRFMQMHFLRGRIEAWGRCLSDVGVALLASAVLTAVYVGIHTGRVSTVTGVLIITASFRLGMVFSWMTWSLGLLFETAGYARRVFEYVDLPAEESEEGRRPPPVAGLTGTPPGDLVFENYSMSYRETTPVILKNLSLRIGRGTKVGLIGRTGAGKSSVVQSIFRMVFVHGGDIRVGDTSLLALPVAEARSLFAVVPQDPYLFEGTIRSNLDRLGEFTDEELEGALRSVQLAVPLSMQLLEGGSNLSLGQRQLLCLARVILTKRPFVIMDEPTSGVDTITDAIMQSVLRTALRDRTIITIAHRLETLARMDRIVELEDGTVLRDGTPDAIIPRLSAEELA